MTNERCRGLTIKVGRKATGEDAKWTGLACMQE